MKEIINHVERILENYDISFRKLNSYHTKMLLLEASNAKRLKSYLKENYHKEIKLKEAKDLEILLQTYEYLSEN
jgi:hypothetical protein